MVSELDPEITPARVLAAVQQWRLEAEHQQTDDDPENSSYYEGQVAAFELLEAFMTK